MGLDGNNHGNLDVRVLLQGFSRTFTSRPQELIAEGPAARCPSNETARASA